MRPHRLEVAAVVREHGEDFLEQWGSSASPQQRKALHDIGVCRSAALGGHVEQCDSCSQRSIAYNSCRNRHCPKCQSAARDRWLAQRAEELLPVRYCHVVFTVPRTLAALAFQNQRVFYRLLFRAVSQTLLELAADPRRLGARIGFFAVLHTWSQSLLYHPHIHCVVPAGGISPDGSRWIPCRQKFFLPVRVLSRLFRGKLLAFLRQAFAQGELELFGELSELAEPARFSAWIESLKKNECVVYAKPPLGRSQHVLKYLARYTHRVAISNGRLLSLEKGRVSFGWRNSKKSNRIQTMTLDAVEFLRRFLLHVLPRGFVKIRYYGFLAHRHRAAELARCRQLLQSSETPGAAAAILSNEQRQAVERRCPLCRTGLLHIVEWLSAAELLTRQADLPPLDPIDSS